MKQIYKLMLSIAIMVLISSIGIAINQDQKQDQNWSSENLIKEENPTSDIAIPEIEEAKLPTAAEEKTRFENRLKYFPRNLENISIQKSTTPTGPRPTIPPSIPSTFPTDVSYSNPITGTSTFGTGFNSGYIYNSDFAEWKNYSFYLPVASYVYIDVSGQMNYVNNEAYYAMYLDIDYLNGAVEKGSCNSGEYCYLPIQRSRLIYLAKGWHTLYLDGDAYVFTDFFYFAYGHISIIAEPEYTAVKVTSPNGGENWSRGTTKTIKWSKNGQPGTNVKIELYKAGVLSVISPKTPNDGSYSWYISTLQPIGTDYKIKITSTSDSKYYDWSNNNFKIY